MWSQFIKTLTSSSCEEKKEFSGSYKEYNTTQLDLLNSQKDLYMNMLRQSKDRMTKGDLKGVNTCYKNYISDSMKILEQGMTNHMEFYKAFPLGFSAVAQTYGDFIENMFEKMNDKTLITPFTQLK